MDNPVGAIKFAKQSLKPDGICMIIEPMANDRLADNLNVIGRTYYAQHLLLCVSQIL
jgi:hypothetical protein